MRVIEVKDEGGLLQALIIHRDGQPYEKGVNFITKENSTLQVGTIFHTKGTTVEPHYHPLRSYPQGITQTIESLVLVRGKIRVDLYGVTEVQSYEIGTGDVLVLFGGGHGFEILEDTEIVETRIGPYLGREKDKTMVLLQNYHSLEGE